MRRPWPQSVLVASVLAACDAPAPPSPSGPAPYLPPARPRCEGRYAELPVVRGQLGDARLIEISGVVASLARPGLLWAHNDSGDAAVLYALSSSGGLVAIVPLPVAVTDLEDIAAASCPDRTGPCLYLADTGNNGGARTDAAVIVVREPVLADDVPAGGLAPVAELVVRLDASPASGLPAALDVEAAVVFPDASALLLFEKVDAGRARVFAREGLSAKAGAFREVGGVSTESPEIEFGRMITGADLHPSGRSLVVRTYTGIFEHRVEAAAALLTLGDVRLTTVTFGPFSEPQGEAVAYDDTGAIVTISEANGRDASAIPVNALVCQ